MKNTLLWIGLGGGGLAVLGGLAGWFVLTACGAVLLLGALLLLPWLSETNSWRQSAVASTASGRMEGGGDGSRSGGSHLILSE